MVKWEIQIQIQKGNLEGNAREKLLLIKDTDTIQPYVKAAAADDDDNDDCSHWERRRRGQKGGRLLPREE